MTAKIEERIWEKEGPQKREAVRRMFDEIAPRYDLLNSVMSLSMHGRWRRRAVATLALKPGNRAIDICCGTGDFIPLLKEKVGTGGNVFGIDFSAPMLASAYKKATGQVAMGDACCLPIASGMFDAATVGWGIRNVPDIDQAHREIARILRPGGRFVSLDMARPNHPVIRSISRLAFRTLVPLLGKLSGSSQAYTYLPESTERFRSREQLAASMASAGFTDIGWTDLFFGNICIHFGTKS